MPGKTIRVSALGTVGVPASYGGFETLVENLAEYHHAHCDDEQLMVYCSTKAYKKKESHYLSAELHYIPLNANGAQSVPYDIWGLLHAMWNRSDVVLQLGVSGAIALPLVRLVSRIKTITNIDGVEWRREKWSPLTKWFLRLSEKLAVRFSHEVIADNGGIADYVRETYGIDAHVIAYGGDHAVAVQALPVDELGLPSQYAFSVCRIEPENNVEMIVEVFSQQSELPLVVVGNWANSDYGRQVRARFSGYKHIHLLDPIYDVGKLKTLRMGARFYVHGHSAGGTNPSLVEAMHFGRPVIAFDCNFNRYTTEERALYFDSKDALFRLICQTGESAAERVGSDMLEIARRRYTWKLIAKQYFDLMR